MPRLKADEADSGAVTLIQRFGSAANLNIHLHCLVLDGVYRRSTEGEPVFVEVAPTSVDSRPCRIHLIAASEHDGRFGDVRRFGVRADAIVLVRCGMACSKQARHAITAERA
jgi:hypothetical protein